MGAKVVIPLGMKVRPAWCLSLRIQRLSVTAQQLSLPVFILYSSCACTMYITCTCKLHTSHIYFKYYQQQASIRYQVCCHHVMSYWLIKEAWVGKLLMSSLLYELCCRVNLLQQTQQLILRKLADCWYIIFVIIILNI